MIVMAEEAALNNACQIEGEPGALFQSYKPKTSPFLTERFTRIILLIINHMGLQSSL